MAAKSSKKSRRVAAPRYTEPLTPREMAREIRERVRFTDEYMDRFRETMAWETPEVRSFALNSLASDATKTCTEQSIRRSQDDGLAQGTLTNKAIDDWEAGGCLGVKPTELTGGLDWHRWRLCAERIHELAEESRAEERRSAARAGGGQ